MATTLLPRLDLLLATTFLKNLGPENLKFSEQNFERLKERAQFAASGGSPIEMEELFNLRNRLLELAKNQGFPLNNSMHAKTTFDKEATKFIAEIKLFNSAEVMRDDIWTFICVALIPDIVQWRFPSANHERFLGGVRNTLQRLWFRAMALDRGPDSINRWELVEELTEDAFVQITERAAIAADTLLARAIAEGWIRMANAIGRTKMENIMRRAIILIRLRNQVELLSSLNERSLSKRVDAAFETAKTQLASN